MVKALTHRFILILLLSIKFILFIFSVLCGRKVQMWEFAAPGVWSLDMPASVKYIIIKPPQSGELCQEITEFVVEGDHLSPPGSGDLPPPQTK